MNDSDPHHRPHPSPSSLTLACEGQARPRHASHLLPVQGVQALHHPRVQLDGVGDVSENLLKGVGGLLIQQNPHGFPRLHPTPDDGDQLGPDEILVLPHLRGALFGRGQGGHCPGSRGGLDVHRPVGVHVLGVLQFLEGLY